MYSPLAPMFIADGLVLLDVVRPLASVKVVELTVSCRRMLAIRKRNCRVGVYL